MTLLILGTCVSDLRRLLLVCSTEIGKSSCFCSLGFRVESGVDGTLSVDHADFGR